MFPCAEAAPVAVGFGTFRVGFAAGHCFSICSCIGKRSQIIWKRGHRSGLVSVIKTHPLGLGITGELMMMGHVPLVAKGGWFYCLGWCKNHLQFSSR
ncbi:hypothetical protein BDW42DRAFT_178592, partial [Aspergillus taichungensis]